jgi:hypothetical protein
MQVSHRRSKLLRGERSFEHGRQCRQLFRGGYLLNDLQGFVDELDAGCGVGQDELAQRLRVSQRVDLRDHPAERVAEDHDRA